MKLQHGWAFPDADVFMVNELHADGGYQASHLRMALDWVTNWSLAIDGGAHVGTWAKPLAGQFQQVIAVEPSSDTFEALTANMAQFNCRNVTLVHAALGAEPGRVDVLLEGRGLAMQNTGARYVQPGDAIPQVTIDSWQVPSLGFLKLDVEGSELAALQGAIQTLKRCRPIVLFEVKGLGRRYGEAKDAPQTFLKRLGYRELAVAGCDRIYGSVQ